MRRTLFPDLFRCFIFMAGAALGSAHAAPPIETSADFALIMDYETGEILFEKAAHVPTAPASMSKLMTAAIVFEKLQSGELKLSDQFTASRNAWAKRGSKMWVGENSKITVENLLRGVIIQSGNDACIVIAENISGSEEAFAALMNAKAREWGLNDSTFANATGWPDPNHKMSMADLGTLARKIIAEYPEFYAIFAEREFTWSKIRQNNRNPILGTIEGADGLKTGHTEESGYGVVGSALVDGVRRIVVVNGLETSTDRKTESRRVMDIAFNDFEERRIFSSGAVVGDAEVFAGKAATIPLVLRDNVDVILHRSFQDKTNATVVYEGPVQAPVSAGQQLGFLRVTVDETTREYPLFAAKDVPALGFFGKVGLAAKKLLLKKEDAAS